MPSTVGFVNCPTPDLAALPPGMRTDLEILRLEGALIEALDGAVAIRSPEQPNFHWGNCVFVTTGDVNDADRWLTAFQSSFPRADWIAIGLPRMPHHASWAHLGLAPQKQDVLALSGTPQMRPLPSGYTTRPLTSQRDWDQLLNPDLAERSASAGHVDAAFISFARAQQRTRQKLTRQGSLSWVGAFTDDGVLAASLGIAVLGERCQLARYQAVLTDPAHRRRGLAGHLLGEAASWAQAQGAEEFVIVTELDNPAGRLYRSVGFKPARANVEVYRAPRL